MYSIYYIHILCIHYYIDLTYLQIYNLLQLASLFQDYLFSLESIDLMLSSYSAKRCCFL